MAKVNYAEKFDKVKTEETENEEVVKVEQAKIVEGTVICDLLNLRKNPNGDIIGKLLKGTAVQLDIDKEDSVWACATTASGMTGYVMLQYIKY